MAKVVESSLSAVISRKDSVKSKGVGWWEAGRMPIPSTQIKRLGNSWQADCKSYAVYLFFFFFLRITFK